MNTLAAPGFILVSDYGSEAFILQSRAEEMTTLVLCQSDYVVLTTFSENGPNLCVGLKYTE